MPVIATVVAPCVFARERASIVAVVLPEFDIPTATSPGRMFSVDDHVKYIV